MERPVFQPVGTPVEELDTPALVLDLDVLGKNLSTMQAIFQGQSAKVRPHISCHLCPNIARLQLAAGGTVGGIAVTTVGEAEVFSNAGFSDILVASQIVTRSKIRRLCALARFNRIAVAVDNSTNVAMLSEVAQDTDVTLQVLVEIDAGLGRCGVTPGTEAVELAQTIARSPRLEFEGLMVRLRRIPNSSADDSIDSKSDTRSRVQSVLDTRALVEREGLAVSVVSVAGARDYEVVATMPGVTEVQAGLYALGDYNSCSVNSQFVPAAKILASVISHPTESRAVVDAGHKATGPDLGVPVLDGVPGATATRFSAEHGILELEGQAIASLAPNDKVWLVPFDLALCVNQYDYFRAVRNGKLEGFWPIAARGRLD